MGQLTMTSFVTLDGVMQAPGGPDEDRSGGFEHGGWLVPHVDEDMGRIVDGIFAKADAFLLGRGTYQIFASHWPRVTDPGDAVAAALNRLPKHVASTTLRSVDWPGASLIRGDVPAAVADLKRRYARELQVHGSPGLAQTLLAHGLVDELRLWIYPVVLGGGKRLFGSGAAPAALKLAGLQTTSTGVVVATYRSAGKPTYGTVGLETEGGGRS
jgi:dihydrofolate reductase